MISAFFYAPWVSAQDCPSKHYDENVMVKSVYDGDTLKLTDGRKIRLIGINTPELARDDQPAQPFAKQARDQLRAIVAQSDQKLLLVYGSDPKDKYQRALAHLYQANGENIQAQLLKQGLATAFTTPPNDRFSRCYQSLESRAIEQKKGIWSLAEYQLMDADQLTASTRGFRRIRGQVSHSRQGKTAFWIKLEPGLSIRIAHNDLKYFELKTIQHLEGKTIIVRGWVHPGKTGHFMNLRHPDALGLIPPPVH